MTLFLHSLHRLETEEDFMRNAEVKRRLISELSLAVKEVWWFVFLVILLYKIQIRCHASAVLDSILVRVDCGTV